MDVIETLEFADFPSCLSGVSALERFFYGDAPKRADAHEVVFVETEGSLVDLSRLFDGLRFPGSDLFDAVLEEENRSYLFHCIDVPEGMYGGGAIGMNLGWGDGSEQVGADRLQADRMGADRTDAGGKPHAAAHPSGQAGPTEKPKFGRRLPPQSPGISFIPRASTHQGTLLYDIVRKVFVDRDDVYYSLRDKRLFPSISLSLSSPHGLNGGSGYEDYLPPSFDRMAPGEAAPFFSWYPHFEAALIAARLGYEPSPELKRRLTTSPPGSLERQRRNTEQQMQDPTRQSTRPEHAAAKKRLPQPLSFLEQRVLLTGVLTGKWAGKGLSFLMDTGFIDAHWPLLASMDRIDHAKEHHPEGNVWSHTVEAFAYRKIRELPLSLGLLLHDCGKPFTGPKNGNAFDRHSQEGASRARKFLRRLEYPGEIVDQVEYFVRHHMLPSYIPKLPFSRTEDVLASPLFPDLLELYRCDVSSTFRGPDGYYEACATYRSFLKNRRNPFRSSSGKKRMRLLVE